LGNSAGNAAVGEVLDSNPSTVEKLARIWQEVLGAAPLTPEQNFFEAGGTPRLAIQLCDQICTGFGYTLAPLALYLAPTPLALARVITQRAPVSFSNALLLKSGPLTPPIFLFHGIGGNVMEFFELVQHLKCQHPVCGLQAKGSDGLEPPLDSVGDMAEYHLKAIREVQPRGPYLLCGYSFGGLIAVEIARKLSGLGETIAMLTMIDAYPHPRHLPTAQRYESYVQRVRDRVRRVLGDTTTSSQTANESQKLSERICGSAIRPVTQAARAALHLYTPKRYSGTVHFVSPEIRTVFPGDPTGPWGGLIGQLTKEKVPGAHHGMLQTSAVPLAAALSRQVMEAVGRQSSNC